MSNTQADVSSFRDLHLAPELLTALEKVGYETPTPIQAQAIPPLLKGLDLLGHAPTGTGKTAAFALPLLSRMEIQNQKVQVMVLTPTRELAIQVAEAFQRYASGLKGFHVLPIYGGQDYSGQIRQLKRGVHVVVGTPGRVMDHMRKGTLRLDGLKALVLDEADEMLRMGFIDDVEWVLEQAPKQRQMALFSATMPRQIQAIVKRHLHDPQEIAIKARTATAITIRQRYWLVSNLHKLDALTRILEVEPFEAVLMFVRTKIATTELAEKLEARGYSAAALNGDMVQKQREQMVRRLKQGSLDILVATDVAARGLDVDRISHVVNYDIPYDIEAYIHRIGRTGRAGRQGDAILFVAPRERRMLYAIEAATRQKIEPLELPSTELVNKKRIADFKFRISETLAVGDLEFMQNLLAEYQNEHDIPAIKIAAALAKISIGDKPWLLKPEQDRPARHQRQRNHESQSSQAHGETRGESRGKPRGKPRSKSKRVGSMKMQTYRIAVGYEHGVKPGNIVGAIANEAELDAQYIGNIDIHTEYSTVDLPGEMPDEVFEVLKDARVCGQKMRLTLTEKSEKRPDGKRATGGKRTGPGKTARSKPKARKRVTKNKGAPRANKKRSDGA
jgi:ATP-dependent RNA helicase DeaD